MSSNKNYTVTDSGGNIKVTDNATGQSATGSGTPKEAYREAVAKLEGRK